MTGRIVAGRINGIHAEPGTILGPKVITREYVVVLTNDERGVTVGYASTHELASIAATDHDVRSVAEHRLQRQRLDQVSALAAPASTGL